MSKYGAIPASSTSSPPVPAPTPAEGSPTAPDATASCATCPGRASALPFRAWRELADPRALSIPPGDLAAARRRARANLAYFAANYQLAFHAVVSASLLWRWRPVFLLPTVLVCLLVVSSKSFPRIMALNLLLLMVTGAAASMLVSAPVGILLVGVHAVLHRPAVDSNDEEAAGSVVWHRGIAPCDTPAAVNELA